MGLTCWRPEGSQDGAATPTMLPCARLVRLTCTHMGLTSSCRPLPLMPYLCPCCPCCPILSCFNKHSVSPPAWICTAAELSDSGYTAAGRIMAEPSYCWPCPDGLSTLQLHNCSYLRSWLRPAVKALAPGQLWVDRFIQLT